MRLTEVAMLERGYTYEDNHEQEEPNCEGCAFAGCHTGSLQCRDVPCTPTTMGRYVIWIAPE